jgi:hypothetical protein
MDLHTLTRGAHVLGASAAVLLACGAPPSADTPASMPAPGAPASGVAALLPLPDGYVIRFRVWLAGAANPEQVIFQVERTGPTHVLLRTGSSVQRLELVPDGVRLVTGGYLLREPLEEGAEWTGPKGPVRVTAVNQTLDVSAGHFSGCLETTELVEQSAAQRTIVTSYCPGVGITTIRVERDTESERFELDSFGPRVDIDAL